MDDFEFGKPILSFMTVGVLRGLLRDYSDDTPITVCGAPGVFFPDNEHRYILLETMDSGEYEVVDEYMEAAGGQEYMDF